MMYDGVGADGSAQIRSPGCRVGEHRGMKRDAAYQAEDALAHEHCGIRWRPRNNNVAQLELLRKQKSASETYIKSYL